MPKFLKQILFSLGLVLFSLRTSAQTLEIVGPKSQSKFTLQDLKSKLTTHSVTVDDIVFKKKMTYDAFKLEDVLGLVGIGSGDAADELLLTASDGYTPTLSFDNLKSHHGYLAYQETGKAGQFSKLDHGKSKIDLGPFYVVWEKSTGTAKLPWSYQLVRIEVVNWQQRYPLMVPPKVTAGSKEMKGFQIFKAECMKCHSINLQGGEVGPELNAPRNVTEYWKIQTLREFISDPGQFRYKSKMPPFKHLGDQDIGAILSYLSHMKKFKIPSPKP